MKDQDIMWSCVACREKVEKALDIDRKIEEKCKEISDLYESRIRKLEDEMKEKVEKDEVRMIARTVCEEVIREKNEEVEVREIAKQVFQEQQWDEAIGKASSYKFNYRNKNWADNRNYIRTEWAESQRE